MQIKKTLLDLNDDCLSEIYRALQTKEFIPIKSSFIIVNDQQANPFTALKCFSVTCKRLRRVSSPFVFKGIRIGHNWEWDRVGRALVDISENSSAAKYATTFVLDTGAEHTTRVNKHGGTFISRKEQSTKPSVDLALAFGTALRKMANLEDLALAVEPWKVFEENVPKTALDQLSIKRVTLGVWMGSWICDLCPQLQDIHLESWEESLELLGDRALLSLPSLRNLNLHIYWTNFMVSTLSRKAPQLEVLNLSRYGDPIHSLPPILARFPNLRELYLSSTIELYNNLPQPQRAPLGPDKNSALKDFCVQVSTALFKECKALKSLDFKELDFQDGYYVEKRQRSDGSVNFDLSYTKSRKGEFDGLRRDGSSLY
ncbi:unnamed protein product [Cercospora beticola]|nr:unnamed protein product [Cercospora beticola]